MYFENNKMKTNRLTLITFQIQLQGVAKWARTTCVIPKLVKIECCERDFHYYCRGGSVDRRTFKGSRTTERKGLESLAVCMVPYCRQYVRHFIVARQWYLWRPHCTFHEIIFQRKLLIL